MLHGQRPARLEPAACLMAPAPRTTAPLTTAPLHHWDFWDTSAASSSLYIHPYSPVHPLRFESRLLIGAIKQNHTQKKTLFIGVSCSSTFRKNIPNQPNVLVSRTPSSHLSSSTKNLIFRPARKTHPPRNCFGGNQDRLSLSLSLPLCPAVPPARPHHTL